jgi:hypothetical protein
MDSDQGAPLQSPRPASPCDAASAVRQESDGELTFDDVPESAASVGAPMLQEYGGRGTFYIAGSLVNRWSGHWNGADVDDITAARPICCATRSRPLHGGNCRS